MSLTMSNATYARSTTGIKNLKANLIGDITAVTKKLTPTSDSYKSMVNTINNYWVGEDATAFIKDLEKQIDTLNKNISNFKKYVDAFDTEQSAFMKFQTNNK